MTITTVIAFARSNFHAKYIDSFFDINLLRMNVKQNERPTINLIEASMHNKLEEQWKCIKTLCVQQIAKAPAIIIIDYANNYLLVATEKGLAEEDLAKQCYI